MRKSFRIGLLLVDLAVLLVASLAIWVHWSARQVPEWYEQAVAADNLEAQKKASGQMEQRTANLISGLESTGRWEVVFTEEQINGWLAVGLEKKHPDALPEGFTEPRVKIEADGVTGACLAKHGMVSGVVSLKVDVYLTEPSVVAIRLRRARLGQLPWPLDRILDGISDSAGKADVPLHWSQAEGDPVAVIRIPMIEDDKRVRIEALQLDEGKLYVAGVTERIP